MSLLSLFWLINVQWLQVHVPEATELLASPGVAPADDEDGPDTESLLFESTSKLGMDGEVVSCGVSTLLLAIISCSTVPHWSPFFHFKAPFESFLLMDSNNGFK